MTLDLSPDTVAGRCLAKARARHAGLVSDEPLTPLARRKAGLNTTARVIASGTAATRNPRPVPAVVAKGSILDSRNVLTWPVDELGQPHHSTVHWVIALSPSCDFHIYADGTFAMWSKRGRQGDPAMSAQLIENHTGFTWCGESIEQHEGTADNQADNSALTT